MSLNIKISLYISIFFININSYSDLSSNKKKDRSSLGILLENIQNIQERTTLQHTKCNIDFELKKKDCVKRYLNQQKIIRIGLVESPGFGHQSASLALIDELTRLGFEGEIEVVVDDRFNDSDDISKKIARLIPQYDPKEKKKQIIKYNNQNISFTNMKKGDPSLKKENTLAIYGAYDFTKDITIKSSEITKIKDSVKSKKVIILQPHQWHQPRLILNFQKSKINGIDELNENALKKRNRTSIISETREVQATLKKQFKTYHQNIQQPPDINRFIAENFSESAENKKTEETNKLRSKEKTSVQLFDSIKRGEIDMMFNYGFHWAEAIEINVQAIKHAQKKGKAKGTVLLLPTEIPSTQLERLPKDIKTVRGDQPNTADIIKNVKPGEVIVVRMGGVPSPIFTEMMRYSTMPAIYEGANTTNKGRLLGKPNMTWDGSKTPFLIPPSGNQDEHKRVVQQLAAVEKAMLVLPTKEIINKENIDPESIEKIGQYIIDAMEKEGPVANYFDELQKEFSSPDNDITLSALAKIANCR